MNDPAKVLKFPDASARRFVGLDRARPKPAPQKQSAGDADPARLTLADVQAIAEEDATLVSELVNKIIADDDGPDVVGERSALAVNLVVRAPRMTERLIANGADDDMLAALRDWLKDGADGHGVNRLQLSRAMILETKLKLIFGPKTRDVFHRAMIELWHGGS